MKVNVNRNVKVVTTGSIAATLGPAVCSAEPAGGGRGHPIGGGGGGASGVTLIGMVVDQRRCRLDRSALSGPCRIDSRSQGRSHPPRLRRRHRWSMDGASRWVLIAGRVEISDRIPIGDRTGSRRHQHPLRRALRSAGRPTSKLAQRSCRRPLATRLSGSRARNFGSSTQWLAILLNES